MFLGDGREKSNRIGWAENRKACFGMHLAGIDAAGEHTHAILIVKCAGGFNAKLTMALKGIRVARVEARTQQEAQPNR